MAIDFKFITDKNWQLLYIQQQKLVTKMAHVWKVVGSNPATGILDGVVAHMSD